MYNTSHRERHQPVRGDALINDENYWPVKLKHRSTSHTKWVNLHHDESTVQSTVKQETMENATKPNRRKKLIKSYVDKNVDEKKL